MAGERSVAFNFEARGSAEVAAAISKIGQAGASTSTQIGGLSGAISRAAAGTQAAVTRFADLGRSIVGIARSAASAITSIASMVSAFGNVAGTVVDARRGFEGMTRSMGGAKAVLAELQAATGGVISNTQLMEGALAFARRGVELSTEELANFFEVAKRNSELGADFRGTLEQIAAAMNRGSIASIGMAVGLDEVKRAQIAASLGIDEANNNLTAQEKRAVALAIAQARLNELSEKYGEQQRNVADRLAEAKAALSNFIDGAITAISTNENLAKALDQAANVLRALGITGENAGELVGKGIAEAIAFIIKGLSELPAVILGIKVVVLDTLAIVTTKIGELVEWFSPDKGARIKAFAQELQNAADKAAVDFERVKQAIQEPAPPPAKRTTGGQQTIKVQVSRDPLTQQDIDRALEEIRSALYDEADRMDIERALNRALSAGQ